MLLLIPFLLFWFLLYFGRGELGIRGILICIGAWLAIVVVFVFPGWPRVLSIAGMALFDIFLVVKAFGGDVNLDF